MGFFNNQMISNINWTAQTPETLVWRFPDVDQVLQNNSTVIIGPGQAFLFVNEGKPAGVITEPGSYDLNTASIPFISSMLAVFRGMDTKHKAKVFFINMNEIPNVKWGTKSPLKYVDPVYGFPVGLRAFGNYSFKISDPGFFFTEFVGDRDEMSLDEFKNVISDRIITPISDTLASAKFGFVDIDSNREELSASIGSKVTVDFTKFGFTMKDFRIENTDFDDETTRRVGEIADMKAKQQAINTMGAIDPASMANYAQLQQLEAMQKAAANPTGIAGMGVGMGVGVGLGAQMAGNFQQMQQPAPQAPVAPAPQPQAPPVEPMPPAQPPAEPAAPMAPPTEPTLPTNPPVGE